MANNTTELNISVQQAGQHGGNNYDLKILICVKYKNTLLSFKQSHLFISFDYRFQIYSRK